VRLFRRGKVWYARFYDASGRRVTISTRCHDRKAAEAFARRAEREAADPDHAAKDSATLNEALEAMIEDAEDRMRAGKLAVDTVEFYRKRAGHLVRAQSVIMPSAPETVLPAKLSLMHARHIDAYIALRRREDVSDKTIAMELNVLSVSLKIAKRRGRWAGDVDAVMPHGFKPGYKARERWLTKPEFVAMLAELAPARAAHVAFIVATSARLKEARFTLFEDVNLTTARVHLRGTKTARSLRTIPLVFGWQRNLVALALRDGDGEGGRIFSTWANMVRDLKKACAAVGIPRCSANDLRRTFTHWMQAEGVPDDVVAPFMGHTDSKMVKTVYGKASADELEARTLRALPAVPSVYQPQVHQADPMDSAESRKAEKLAPAAGLEPATRWLTAPQFSPNETVTCESRCATFEPAARPPLRRAEDRVTRLVLEGLALATGEAADVDEAGCLARLDEAARLLLERRTA
jgi:integrase